MYPSPIFMEKRKYFQIVYLFINYNTIPNCGVIINEQSNFDHVHGVAL